MKFYKASDVTVLVEAFDLALELLHAPEHAQDDEWYERQKRCYDAFEDFAAITPVEVPKIDIVQLRSSREKWEANVGVPALYGDGVKWENDRIRKIMEGGK